MKMHSFTPSPWTYYRLVSPFLSPTISSFVSLYCDSMCYKRWSGGPNGSQPVCSSQWWGGHDFVMGQIGHLTRPPVKVMVFQGWQGLHGKAKGRGIENGDCGWGVWVGKQHKEPFSPPFFLLSLVSICPSSFSPSVPCPYQITEDAFFLKVLLDISNNFVCVHVCASVCACVFSWQLWELVIVLL